MTTGVRKRLLGGLAVTAITGALTPSGGNVGAQPANPVTLTLMPAALTPPGTVTARVEILGSVPTTNTINLLVIATDAQLGPPVLVNGSWQPGTCTGEGTPFVEIHPDDASQRGIRSGDDVILGNGRGECRLRAVVTDGVRPGVVVSPKGRWGRLSGGRNVNWLTTDALGDFAGQSSYHSSRVWLRRAGEPRPE